MYQPSLPQRLSNDKSESPGISPFQKPHDMGEKYFAQLEEVEHEEGPSGAALDRFVVLLNWTFLSAVAYIFLNSTYLLGAAFRAPFTDASVWEHFWELVGNAYGPMSHSSSSTPSETLSSHYTIFRGLVYTSILLGFVVASLIILGKSFMGYYALNLRVSPRRNSHHRLSSSSRRFSHIPPWFRRTLELLPTAFPLAQAVISTAIVVTHHFAL